MIFSARYRAHTRPRVSTGKLFPQDYSYRSATALTVEQILHGEVCVRSVTASGQCRLRPSKYCAALDTRRKPVIVTFI